MNLKRATILIISILISLMVNEIKARPHIEKVLRENGLTSSEKEEEGIVKFTKYPPETIEYEIGSVAEIECEALGSSDLSVQWVPGNMAELDPFKNYSPNPATIVKIRSVLVIEHLKQKETFSCIATSLHTGKQIITKTTILPRPPADSNDINIKKRNLRSPKIIQNYSLFMGTIGSSMMLPCQTSHPNHRPAVKKFWIDFNNNIVNENNSRFTVTHNGDLIITDLQWKDMGLYKCIVENSHGRDSANTFVYPVLDE
ncbi:neural/ectodermal development factor IMP-L2-like [Condylostylus longicornis]|uniref:neural/ectodermal development factor IMP-L2-like n=1 Tax=Condylostylus longicornis TaxID=2530218 RepID=UPI00244DBAB9|nr:neural/ectodermal development factor IMP-L2-like [Condylostylus longicornis]